MRLSDYKGEKALDVLADLIEPAAEIMADREISRLAKADVPKIKIVKAIIKNHKREVIEIMAILDGENPKVYAEKINVLTVPSKLLEILNDPELIDLFTSQSQKADETHSGSAMENTKEPVQ